MSFIKPRLNKSLEHQIELSIENYPLHLKKKFKLALTPHKFDSEIFIPKKLKINRPEYLNKNYLLNKLMSFESVYQSDLEKRLQLKKQTEKFSKQYEKINDEKYNHKKNNYLKLVEEQYKLEGYNMNDLKYSKNENIFSPSIIFDETEPEMRLTLRLESSKNIIKDNKFLSKIDESISNLRKKKSDDEIEIKKKLVPKRSSIMGEEYINAVINVKEKIKEELKMRNMTLNQLKKYNKELRKEIILTNLSLKDVENENKKLKQSRNTKNIFLLTKGMKTIQKRNKRKNKLMENLTGNNYKKDNKIMIIDHQNENDENNLSPINKKIILTDINDKEKYEKQKIEKLKSLYNKLIETNYYANQNESKKYISIYTNKKIPIADSNRGSDLHGLFQDFQKRSKQINLPNKANLINSTKRYIFNKTYANSIDFDGNALNDLKKHLYNVDELTEEENKIDNMAYNYSYDILSENNKIFNM